MTDRPGPPSEVETASVEEFLRLLSGRERGTSPSRSPTRRAVFVAPLQDVRSSGYAFPKVTRHVVATFAYGPDVVSYKRTTSNAVELPEVARKLAQRHRETYEQVRAEIERGINDANLGVPMREGYLRHSRDHGTEE